MTYLFLAHIGPVQEFIASARRSRDLWFGSWLLSELSKSAAAAIADQNTLDSLVFPAPQDRSDLVAKTELTVANRVVAVVEQEPSAIGEAVRDAVVRRLQEIKQEAFQGVRGDYDEAVATRQVDDLLEYFWVAMPLPDPSQYASVRAQVEALMAARKATRDFSPVTWGAQAPKSSLDGLRESVIPEEQYDKVRRGSMKAETLRKLYGVGPAERLCGVGLLKRHGKRPGTHPLRQHVARGSAATAGGCRRRGEEGSSGLCAEA